MPYPEPRYMLCTGECVPYRDLYKFPKSHIIGHFRYIVDEGKKVSALARWDVSVSCVQVPPVEPVIDADLIGDVRNIRCRYAGCENRQRWEIGKAAFMQLLSRYGIEKIEDVQK